MPTATKRPGGEAMDEGASGVTLRLTDVTSNAGAFGPGGAGIDCATFPIPLATTNVITAARRIAIVDQCILVP